MKQSLLELENVTVGHGGRSVLSGINLSITAGRWFALVGPNTSGKTTLLHAIAGRIAPMQGVIRIDGEPLQPATRFRQRLPVLAVPVDEIPGFLNLRQCMEIYAEAHGYAQLPQSSIDLISALGLDPHVETLVKHASLGTRQKLSVVLALMIEPSILLLDEVFNGLDFASAAGLRNHLRQRVDQGVTILMATHSLDLVLRCCDELALVDSGRLVNRWETRGFIGPDAQSRLEESLAASTSWGP
jgi:ABC-2 type transport system ATP-binding protein